MPMPLSWLKAQARQAELRDQRARSRSAQQQAAAAQTEVES